MIQKMPIYIDLDRKRRIIFNLNTEILIRNGGGDGKGILETIGVRPNKDTGKDEPILRVNPENLRLYLWAAIQEDGKSTADKLTLEDVGRLINSKRAATDATGAIITAIAAYYGDEPGEAQAPLNA